MHQQMSKFINTHKSLLITSALLTSYVLTDRIFSSKIRHRKKQREKLIERKSSDQFTDNKLNNDLGEQCQIPKEQKITCLLGAGTALDICGPQTSYITTKIKEDRFLKEITLRLDDYYNDYNFETVFHLLELLQSYRHIDPSDDKIESVGDKYKPVLGAFVTKLDEKFFDATNIIESREFIFKLIYDLVDLYEKNDSHKWYESFWQRLNEKNKLNVYSLNYDFTVQNAIKDYEDGYEKIERTNFSKFNATRFFNSSKTKIVNLHGSIHHGYFPTFSNIFSNDKHQINHSSPFDEFNELYKYESSQNAFTTWFHRSLDNNQAAETIQSGPIITGLSPEYSRPAV